MAALPQHVRELPKVFLRQGEVYATGELIVVQTTLGSCVSVAAHDPVTKVGAMCHAVLPAAPDDAERSLRYVDQAVERLFDEFAERGVPVRRLAVKVIGGSSNPRVRNSKTRFGPVGMLNVDAALAELERRGIVVAAQDTGGDRGRRVLFLPTSGEIFVRPLRGHALAVD